MEFLSIPLSQCKWQKHLNQLICQYDSRFPNEVRVCNTITNSHRVYELISALDPRYDQDGWDGEQMVYKTRSPTNSAEYLVLYHGA